MAGDFYETIPVLGNFADAVRAENYRPLPGDWAVGFADVDEIAKIALTTPASDRPVTAAGLKPGDAATAIALETAVLS